MFFINWEIIFDPFLDVYILFITKFIVGLSTKAYRLNWLFIWHLTVLWLLKLVVIKNYMKLMCLQKKKGQPCLFSCAWGGGVGGCVSNFFLMSSKVIRRKGRYWQTKQNTFFQKSIDERMKNNTSELLNSWLNEWKNNK